MGVRGKVTPDELEVSEGSPDGEEGPGLTPDELADLKRFVAEILAAAGLEGPT